MMSIMVLLFVSSVIAYLNYDYMKQAIKLWKMADDDGKNWVVVITIVVFMSSAVIFAYANKFICEVLQCQ